MSKIAFCFLTYDNLSQPKLWSDFIKKNKDKLNVYIHNKNTFKDEKYGLDEYCIKNKVRTRWGGISLVKATLLLFQEAYLDQDNAYFVLLSDKCIPLYNFDTIYQKIFDTNSNIISCYNQNRHRYNLLANKTFFERNKFMKQSQWFLLNRDTAKFFIDNDFTHVFGEKRGIPPDEHYFINICIKYKIKYINSHITFVNWRERSDSKKYRSQPKTYDNLTNEMIENIIKNDNFLFMRKISKDCVLPSYFDTMI